MTDCAQRSHTSQKEAKLPSSRPPLPRLPHPLSRMRAELKCWQQVSPLRLLLGRTSSPSVRGGGQRRGGKGRRLPHKLPMCYCSNWDWTDPAAHFLTLRTNVCPHQNPPRADRQWSLKRLHLPLIWLFSPPSLHSSPLASSQQSGSKNARLGDLFPR